MFRSALSTPDLISNHFLFLTTFPLISTHSILFCQQTPDASLASLAPPVLATFCHAALSVSPSARVSRPAMARETLGITIIETTGISLQTSCFCSEQLALGSGCESGSRRNCISLALTHNFPHLISSNGCVLSDGAGRISVSSCTQ